MREIKMIVGAKPIGRAVTWSYPSDDGKLYEIPTYDMSVSGNDDAGAAKTAKFEVFRFGVLRRGRGNARVVGLRNQQTHVIKMWIPTYEVHSASSSERGAWQVYGNFLIHDGPDKPLDTASPFASIGCVEVCGATGFIKLNDFIISLSGATQKTRTAKLTAIGRSGKMKVTYQAATRPPLKEFRP